MYQKAASNLEIESNIDLKNVIINIFAGTLELAKNSEDNFETLKNKVSTPNGTTAKGLIELEKSYSIFTQTLT